MDEQKATKGEEQADTVENPDEGSKYETTPIIERARVEREAMEKATREAKIENDRREKIQSQAILGGDIPGATPKVEPKEETPQEYAKRIMSGEDLPDRKDNFDDD